jgi:hypothetical protein
MPDQYGIPDFSLPDFDWSTILNNPQASSTSESSSTATGGASNVNIDMGDIFAGLGGYLGYEGANQPPQFANLKDLYGGDYEERMKGLRDQILAQDPNSWLADLNDDQLSAVAGMSGWGAGAGGDIFAGQMGQGTAGGRGLESGMDFADMLRGGGGPEYEYDQDVFDQSMQNLMPGVQGSYIDQTQDIFRELNEQAIPGLNLAAAGTGNMAGSRAGLTEGVLTRGALDRSGDIGSQLMQNALNKSQAAAYGAGGATLDARMGTQGDIFGGYGSTAQYGLPGYGDAWNTGTGNIDYGMDAGNFMQAFDQAGLNAPRDLMGWQIPLMNQTTPAGVGSMGAPYISANPLAGMMEGINMGRGAYDAWQNPYSTAANAAGR